MEAIRTESELVTAVAASGALGDDPLVVVDVGCALGIDGGWRCFGDHLVAFGFDPNLDEVDRLRAAESHPGVRYQGGWVGLPPGHPSRHGEGQWLSRNPWARLSTAAAVGRQSACSAGDLAVQNRWREARLASEDAVIVLPEYLREHGVEEIDFLKIDVDGPDFEVLISAGDMLGRGGLGVGLEVNYFGSAAPTDHTFHNTDRYLRERDFELFGLTTRTYSAAALPARFVYPMPAQTVSGRILQGDAVYFRDLASPEHDDAMLAAPVSGLLKLAGLFDLFGLPDCAAELLVAARARIEPVLAVEPLLDLLVPDPWNGKLSYEEYLARFAENDAMFYPEP